MAPGFEAGPSETPARSFRIGIFRRNARVEIGPSAAQRAGAVQALRDVRDAHRGPMDEPPVDPEGQDAVHKLVFEAWVAQIEAHDVERHRTQAEREGGRSTRAERKQLLKAQSRAFEELMNATANALALPPRAIRGSYGLRSLYDAMWRGLVDRPGLPRGHPISLDFTMAQLQRMRRTFPTQQDQSRPPDP